MGQTIVQNGLILEVQPDGTGKVVGYADQPQSQGRIFSLPQSPEKQREQARQEAADRRAEADFQRRQAEWNATHNPDGTPKGANDVPAPGDVTKSGEEYLRTLPPALAAQVKALAEGRRAFPTGSALKSPAVQELIAAATQFDPTLDAANAATRVSTRKDFTSGKAAQNITSINTAIGHLGTLSDAADKLDNSSFPLWNRLGNAALQQTGDPRIKNFTVARDAVANELMRVFRGTGASTSEIQEWQHTLDSADSPEQLHAAISKATELLSSRLDAMGQQYKQGMGQSADVMQLLSPHSQQVYTKLLGGGTGPADGGNGGGPSGGQPPQGSSPLLTGATDGNQYVRDPRANAMVATMLNAKAGLSTINAALAKRGFPDGLKAGDYARAMAFLNNPKNKGQQYTADRVDVMRTEPLSAGQRILNSEAIAPYAAGAASYANMAAAGIPAALSGPEGQGKLDAAATLHPDANVIGETVGGITGAMAGEGLVGNLVASKFPQLAARFPAFVPRAADALYGGTLGFNQAPEGEGLSGAGKGAAAAVIGGFLGDRAVRLAGKGVKGVTNPMVEYLQQEGIPLTVGQALSQSGKLGGAVKGIEDALTSFPGLSAIINGRRREGLEGFNHAAFNAVAQPTGNQIEATGAQGIDLLRAIKNQSYDNALNGVHIDPSLGSYPADRQALDTAAAAIPNVNGAQDAANAALTTRLDGAVDPNTGLMSGRHFQEAYRGLGRTARERANGDYGHEVGQVMRQGQDALAGALEDQNPGAFANFRLANDTNRRLMTLSSAVDKAKSGDELFTPAQLNTADAAATRKLSGPLASATGDRDFYNLTQAGQAVLPSKVPDSGTSTRALVGSVLTGGLGGAGLGTPFGYGQEGGEAGLGLTLLLAAGGSKAAQHGLVTALTRRSPAVRRAGQLIADNAPIGGWTGAGILTPLLVGQ